MMCTISLPSMCGRGDVTACPNNSFLSGYSHLSGKSAISLLSISLDVSLGSFELHDNY